MSSWNGREVCLWMDAMDPYQAVAILDLKRGWTGINNVIKINYAF